MYKSSRLLFFILLLKSTVVFSQFQSGIFSSNFSGIMGVHVNPAGTSWLSDGADFLPLAFGIEALNNGFYLDAKPITHYLNRSLADIANDTLIDNAINNLKSRYRLKKNLQPDGYARIHGVVFGPSLLINHRKRSFGFITSLKTYTSGVNMPPEMISFIFDAGEPSSINLNKPFSTSGFNFASANFLDLGYTNSNLVFNSAFDQVRFGFNARFLIGITSFFFNDFGSTYTINSDTSITFKDAGFKYGYAAHRPSLKEKLLTPRAGGTALDIGVLYVRKKYPSPTRVKKKCPNIYGYYRDYQTYKWRFGASVTDIGSLFFFNQTYYRKVENINYNYKGADSLVLSAISKFDVNVKSRIAAQSGVTYNERSSFNMVMPTRLNLQFDAHLKNHWYAGFLLSQRISIPGLIAIRSANIITSSLRYETQYFEFALPVSVIEYNYPTAGLYARIGFLFFGTNTLPELIGVRNIKNLDFYMGIKVNLGFVGSRFGMGF
ncbi:MAG: DUF5723 family protein [Bacteroidia bacterium]